MLCAQTHVPYLPLGVGMVAGAIAVGRRSADRARRPQWSDPQPAVGRRIGVVLWVPPLVDQAVNDPGNIRQLLSHFGSPPEAAIGVVEGAKVVLRHLDVWGGSVVSYSGPTRSATPVRRRGSSHPRVVGRRSRGAWRIGSSALRSLHVAVAVALSSNAVSTARIFGRPWFYLTLWAWGITAVLVGSPWPGRRSTAWRHVDDQP